MERFQIPEEVRPFTDALRKLLPTGVTAAPKLEEPPLLDMDVVATWAGSQADPHQKAMSFTEMLTSLATEGTPGALMGKDREAAERLFGLGEWAGAPSRQRYEAVAKLYDKRWTWENFRKEPLDRHLYAVYLGLCRLAKKPGEPSKNASQLSNLIQYKLCDYDVTYRMPATPGQAREELEIREIEALADGVTSWRASTRYWGKSADVGPDITLFGPGSLEIRADTPIMGSGGTLGRAYTTEVTFPTPLKQGERIRFTLLKRQAVEFDDLVRPDWQDNNSLTPAMPVDRASIRICFPNGKTPKDIWHFADLEDWLAPGVITDESRLAVDVSNSVVHTWKNLHTGRSYGIGWRWVGPLTDS